MKLIHYTIRNLLFPLLLIMAVWACAFYFLILQEVYDETDDSLENQKELIIKSFLFDTTLLSMQSHVNSPYYIREIPAEKADITKNELFDSTKWIEIEREFEPVRVLRTNFLASNGKYYELTIEMSTLEKEDLVEKILFSIILLYCVLLICILLVTHFVFRKSFRPLYAILNWLKHPDKPIQPFSNQTVVEEFKVLNKALEEASVKSKQLYDQQKQFVENASHELQTPLAICRNKLELLGERTDCTEEQLAEIESIQRSLTMIIRTNKSLLLLSRIENNQFHDIQSIDFNQLTLNIIDNFSEMYEDMNIQVSIVQKGNLVQRMNESLAMTLIRNLVKNAYIHNHSHGSITINISDKQWRIKNTSQSPELNRDKLFRRFEKQSDTVQSTGLGLAIAKSICSIYGIRLQYDYDSEHHFILTF